MKNKIYENVLMLSHCAPPPFPEFGNTMIVKKKNYGYFAF